MSEIPELIQAAGDAGLNLRAESGRLVLSGPDSAAEIAKAILARKSEVLEYLERDTTEQPDPSNVVDFILFACREFEDHPPATLSGFDSWSIPETPRRLLELHSQPLDDDESQTLFINQGLAFASDAMDPYSSITLHEQRRNLPPANVPTIPRATVITRESTWADDSTESGWITLPAGTRAEPVKDIAKEWHDTENLYLNFIAGLKDHNANGRPTYAVRIAGKVRMIDRESVRL